MRLIEALLKSAALEKDAILASTALGAIGGVASNQDPADKRPWWQKALRGAGTGLVTDLAGAGGALAGAIGGGAIGASMPTSFMERLHQTPLDSNSGTSMPVAQLARTRTGAMAGGALGLGAGALLGHLIARYRGPQKKTAADLAAGQPPVTALPPVAAPQAGLMDRIGSGVSKAVGEVGAQMSQPITGHDVAFGAAGLGAGALLAHLMGKKKPAGPAPVDQFQGALRAAEAAGEQPTPDLFARIQRNGGYTPKTAGNVAPLVGAGASAARLPVIPMPGAKAPGLMDRVAGALKPAGAAIGNLGAKVKPLVTNPTAQIAAATGAGGLGMGAAMGALGERAHNNATPGGQVGNVVNKVNDNVVQPVVQAAQDGWGKVKEFAQPAIDATGEYFNSFKQPVSEWGGKQWGGVAAGGLGAAALLALLTKRRRAAAIEE